MEKFLPAQVLQTRTLLLSVKVKFPSTMSPFSNTAYEREKNINCSRKRPLAASRRRGVWTFPAPAENGGTGKKHGQKPSVDNFNRLSPFEKACVD